MKAIPILALLLAGACAPNLPEPRPDPSPGEPPASQDAPLPDELERCATTEDGERHCVPGPLPSCEDCSVIDAVTWHGDGQTHVVIRASNDVHGAVFELIDGEPRQVASVCPSRMATTDFNDDGLDELIFDHERALSVHWGRPDGIDPDGLQLPASFHRGGFLRFEDANDSGLALHFAMLPSNSIRRSRLYWRDGEFHIIEESTVHNQGRRIREPAKERPFRDVLRQNADR